MLFHIDDSIRQVAEQAIPPDYISDFTEEIFRARRMGRHIIYAHPSTLDALEKLPGLSNRTIQTIRKIKERVRSKKSLFESIPTHVRVVANSDVAKTITEGNRKIIEIPAKNITDDSFFRATILLVENHSDGELYKYISKIFNLASTPNQNVRQDFEIFPGGGSQTPRHYDLLKKEGRFTFCIVDGDMEFPTANLGTNTAAPIFDSTLNNPTPFSDSLVLDCYSIENLIPPALIRGANGLNNANIPWLTQLEECYTKEFWPFLPLKRKKECTAFRGETTQATYWREYKVHFQPPPPACAKWDDDQHCEKPCTVLKPLSDKTLAKVVAYIDAMQANGKFRELTELVDGLPAPVAELWEAIAKNVTSWGCSGERIAAA